MLNIPLACTYCAVAEADKLFLYEKFAPYGGILSVKVLTDGATGRCRCVWVGGRVVAWPWDDGWTGAVIGSGLSLGGDM